MNGCYLVSIENSWNVCQYLTEIYVLFHKNKIKEPKIIKIGLANIEIYTTDVSVLFAVNTDHWSYGISTYQRWQPSFYLYQNYRQFNTYHWIGSIEFNFALSRNLSRTYLNVIILETRSVKTPYNIFNKPMLLKCENRNSNSCWNN